MTLSGVTFLPACDGECFALSALALGANRPLLDVGVKQVIGVSKGTVGLGSLVSACVAALGVLRQGDHFEMIGIDASTDAAEVVNYEILGDRADEDFIGKAVGAYGLALMPETAVTSLATETLVPEPARLRKGDLLKEAFERFLLAASEARTMWIDAFRHRVLP